MKHLLLIVTLMGLSACASWNPKDWTPEQKNVAYFVGGVVLTSIAISSSGDTTIINECQPHGKHKCDD